MTREEAEDRGYGPEEIHGDREPQPEPITYGDLSEDVRRDIASELTRLARLATGLAAGIDYSGVHSPADVLAVIDRMSNGFRDLHIRLQEEVLETISERNESHPSLTAAERNPGLGGLDRSRSL